ncbi:roadblock/LC7 domain-containing protein [Embleya sp. NPDC005575]|uniref:roadblock/LC7 domain-containing protein n=1 Tax=Embleya sp. NPDC005575 TaxID=3156892 RepID=UPI0033A4BCF2
MTQARRHSMNEQPDHSAWAERLVRSEPGIASALFFTADGLKAGAHAMDVDTQDSVASMGSGLHSTAKATVRAMASGDGAELEIRNVVVDTDQGYLIVMDAGKNTRLAAFTTPDAELGTAAYSMLKLIALVGRGVGAETREDVAQ